MICLDTNYLILGLVDGSRESEQLIQWYKAGKALIVPMPVWYEFLCGPVNRVQVEAVRGFLAEIIPFGETHAARSVELFESVGRKRSLKIDAMIAATAVLLKAPLATNNDSGFRKFVDSGFRLYPH